MRGFILSLFAFCSVQISLPYRPYSFTSTVLTGALKEVSVRRSVDSPAFPIEVKPGSSVGQLLRAVKLDFEITEPINRLSLKLRSAGKMGASLSYTAKIEDLDLAKEDELVVEVSPLPEVSLPATKQQRFSVAFSMLSSPPSYQMPPVLLLLSFACNHCL